MQSAVEELLQKKHLALSNIKHIFDNHHQITLNPTISQSTVTTFSQLITSL